MKLKETLKLVGLIALVLVMNACAASKHVSLQPDAIPNITSTDICLAVSQQEIYGDIEKSGVAAAMGGGLLPALIDVAIENSRSKDAESQVASIRNELVDYDFKGVLKNKIQSELNSVEWMKVRRIDLEGVVSPESFDKYLTASDASSVLFITTKYFFSPDFKTLEIASDVQLFPNNDELRKFAKSYDSSLKPTDNANCIYRNSFVFRDRLDIDVKSNEEAVKLWADNNASLTKEALEKGTDETAKMISIDLVGNTPDGQEKITVEHITGEVIESNGDRNIIRGQDGTMYSLKTPAQTGTSQE